MTTTKSSSPWRTFFSTVGKALLTVGAFYLLLTHKIKDESGQAQTIWSAVQAHMQEIRWNVFVPLALSATFTKLIGIVASMARWHLLLIGQGIRFNFSHVAGSFLIGRFLGTFLPSTLGLDGYKLYDAARFSGKVVEPAAATAVEKVMGLAGVFLTFLVTLPLGYAVLGKAAWTTAALTVPIALCAVLGLFGLLFRPAWMETVLSFFPKFLRNKAAPFLEKLRNAATAYQGKGALLGRVLFLSFLVHFCTAAMYYFTALAVGAVQASFWQVTFASSIQIFATVISPFTIAGEGVREIVQALLLAKHLGLSESVLSAALGFWAAEALTLFGGIIWWLRRSDYRPRLLQVQTSSLL